MATTFFAGIIYEEFSRDFEDFGKPSYKIEPLHFPETELGTFLYLKSKTWGITGNHRVSVLSTKSNFEFEPDTLSDFCFYDFDEFIYRKKTDTLQIFTYNELNIPPNFNSKIKVEVVKINTMEYLKMKKEIDSGYFRFE